MERFEKIAAQYNVTSAQIVMASQNASESAADVESEEWYDVFAASLGSYEEKNNV
jgi:hypothetical protein